MLRRKRANAQEAPPAEAQMPQQTGSTTGPNGYVVTELPTYHAGKRKVVVYTSDSTGKIIKRFKR